MTTEAEILRSLGRVEASIDSIRQSISHLREDFGDEKDHAHESRTVIHRRLDEQAQKIGHLETTVAIKGEVEAQLRNSVNALHDEIAPTLAEWQRIKILGAGAGAVLLVLGISIGSVIVWASDTAVAALRHWLRIS